MTIYPLLRVEYLKRSRRAWFYIYPTLLLLSLGVLTVICIFMWKQSPDPSNDHRLALKVFTVVSLFQTVSVVILAPFLTLRSMAGDRKDTLFLTLCLSFWRSPTIVFGLFFLPFLFLVLLISVSGMPVWAFRFLIGSPELSTVLSVNLMLLLFGVFFGLAGLFCSTLFKNVSSSAAVVYAVIIVLMLNVIMAGPLSDILSTYKDFIMRASLLTNPIAGISSLIGFDVMRTDWLYANTSVGQRRLDYPSFFSLTLFYSAAAFILFIVSSWRIEHLRRSHNK